MASLPYHPLFFRTLFCPWNGPEARKCTCRRSPVPVNFRFGNGERDHTLSARYVRGKEKAWADAFSRFKGMLVKWHLHPQIFHKVLHYLSFEGVEIIIILSLHRAVFLLTLPLEYRSSQLAH